MATHSRILVGRISWTEEPGGLQSMGSQTFGHDRVTNTHTHTHTHTHTRRYENSAFTGVITSQLFTSTTQWICPPQLKPAMWSLKIKLINTEVYFL